MKYTFLLCTALLAFSCQNRTQTKTGLEGKPLPAFTLLLADGATRLKSADIPEGKSFGIMIFSPHCPYCRAQTKQIIADRDKLNMKFYFVTSYPFSEMKQYCDEYQLSKYPEIVTGFDSAYETSTYFGASGVPFVAIFGKDKKLKGAYMGNVNTSAIQSMITE
jgi:thiol-disulfide isomerase/thioredoxin